MAGRIPALVVVRPLSVSGRYGRSRRLVTRLDSNYSRGWDTFVFGLGRPSADSPALDRDVAMSTASFVSVESVGAAASRGVLGRGSVYTLGAAAPILAYAAVVPIATRLLGKQAYGVVAISIVVITVAMMAGSLGMPSVIVRQGILAGSGVAGARALLVRGSLMTAGLMGAIILTAPMWDQLVHDPNPLVQAQLRSAFPLALAASTFFVVVENSQALLRVLDRPGSFVVLSLTATLGGPLLGLALLVQDRSPKRYLIGLTAGYAAAATLGLVLCLRGGRRHRQRRYPRGPANGTADCSASGGLVPGQQRAGNPRSSSLRRPSLRPLFFTASQPPAASSWRCSSAAHLR
jgi:hypothetical protein